MVIVWIMVALVVLFIALSFYSLYRLKMPLEPNLTPGDVSEARDPDFFAEQAGIFAGHGYSAAGDYCWHENLSTLVMRSFLSGDGRVYGWVLEESLAGSEGAACSVSLLTEMADGGVIDTTTRSSKGMAVPGWFLRETVPGGAEGVIRRHHERLAGAEAGGGRAIGYKAEELEEVIRRRERRLNEYQVESGRMRVSGGKLRYRISVVLVMSVKGLFYTIAGLFRRKG